MTAIYAKNVSQRLGTKGWNVGNRKRHKIQAAQNGPGVLVSIHRSVDLDAPSDVDRKTMLAVAADLVKMGYIVEKTTGDEVCTLYVTKG